MGPVGRGRGIGIAPRALKQGAAPLGARGLADGADLLSTGLNFEQAAANVAHTPAGEQNQPSRIDSSTSSVKIGPVNGAAP